jgi:hypothetical protein
VRLVEAVGGEAAELAEDLLRDLAVGTQRRRLLDEGAADLSISSRDRSWVMARRSMSASARLKPATAEATSMTCSW